MNGRMPLTDTERLRIGDAISLAETKTAGEIFVVVARMSNEYRAVPLLWATLASLVVPLPLLFLRIPESWVHRPGGGWDGAAAATSIGLPASWIYLAQLAVFIVLALVLAIPAIRPHVVPGSVKRARAHALAVDQFLAHGLHMTEARTGVLIFVSLAERYAEIIADAAIADRVEQAVWDESMSKLLADIREGRLTDGLVGAIERAGALLARHFPPRPRNPDELSNDLVLI